MADDSADIRIKTTGLRYFAGDSSVDLDVDSISGQVSAATAGSSQMEEGTAFHSTHQQALQAITQHLQTVRQGNYGLRDGANRMADTYVSTEGDVTTTMRSVVPFQGSTQPTEPTEYA